MRGMLSGRAVEMSTALEAGGLPGAVGNTAPGVASGAAAGGAGAAGAGGAPCARASDVEARRASVAARRTDMGGLRWGGSPTPRSEHRFQTVELIRPAIASSLATGAMTGTVGAHALA
jgi:hypothetical protein